MRRVVLPCGCVRGTGHRLCDEAKRLKQATSTAYNDYLEWPESTERWDRYQAARQSFADHFLSQEKRP